ncbi:LysR family transcriptional regulator [Aquabacterium sp. A08]|uniref:LysR family transcriptional regulator n=1 Tax=Aquabacterium sp. A08 TaxID=2718532 RepID=UPI001422862F|nr:LysR family transcriptional regulator [Aquabacterium sp. A08]NIC42884.1 LysR family transcriptional regulator [Aquabacterium sp. A08]
MTLVQLRHFIALADAASFAKAARLLCLTQPALSRSIQALEDELAQRLFDRVGRRIELTPLGQQLLPRAQRLVQEADSLKALGREMQAGVTGTVRIGLGSGPGALLSVPLLRHMAQHHPRLHLELARGHTDLLIHALRARRLDAAVVDIRALRPAADLRVTNPVEMPGRFLCRAGHPLHQRGTPVPFEDLRAYPIASTPLSDEVARLLTERFGPAANPDDLVTLRCDDTPTLVELARHSDAIVLTIEAAGRDLKSLTTVPALNGTARFGLVTLDQRAEAPGLAIVRELVRQWLAG